MKRIFRHKLNETNEFTMLICQRDLQDLPKKKKKIMLAIGGIFALWTILHPHVVHFSTEVDSFVGIKTFALPFVHHDGLQPNRIRAARTWSTWTSRLWWSQRTASHSQSSSWPPPGRRSRHGPVTSARHVSPD